jgi:hypothetical protein
MFTGNAHWLEIDLRRPGDGTFIPLKPREAVTPVPYAMYALVGAGGLNSAGC